MNDSQFYVGGLMDLSAYRLDQVEDHSEWNSLVETSKEGTIFNLTAFTDALSDQITNLGCYKGDELLGGISLMETGSKAAQRPELVIYNSPMLRKSDDQQASANQFAEQFRTLAVIVRELTKRYQTIEIQTHYELNDTRPFEWHNYGLDLPRFEFYPRHTCVLDLSDSFGFEDDYLHSPLYLRCSKSRRQEIRYAIAGGVNVQRRYDSTVFSELYKQTFDRQGVKVDQTSLRELLSLCDGLEKAQKLMMYIATDANGDVGSVAVFGLDSKRAYYLYGANSAVARRSHTGSMVLFSAFLDLMKMRVSEVDLEGINSPARGHFKMSFGGNMRTYSSMKLRAQ